MKNFKVSVVIFVLILLSSVLLNHTARRAVNRFEAQTAVIAESQKIDSHREESFAQLKDEFKKRKKYLKLVVDKDHIFQLESNINQLENSIKEKDITSGRENCTEIMSVLDNIESYYVSVF